MSPPSSHHHPPIAPRSTRVLPDQCVRVSLDALLYVSDAALATIGVSTGEEHVLHWRHRGGEQGQLTAELGDGLYGWVLRTGQPIVAERIGDDWRAGPVGLSVPDGACVVQPWCVGEPVDGVVAVHRDAGPAFSAVDLRQVQSIGTLLHVNVTEWRAQQQHEQQRQHLHALTEISRVLVAATDPKTVLALVVDMTMTLSPATACWLFLTDAVTGQPALAAARGLPRHALSHLAPGEGYGPGMFQQLPVLVDGEVVGSLELMRAAELHPVTHDTLQALANMAGVALRQIHTHGAQQRLLEEAILALVAALEARDPYTQGHSLRVAEFATWLAEALHLDRREVQLLRLAGYLHDIGKIGIPEAILHKPGRFTPDEIAVMQQHPVIAHHILSHISGLRTLLPLVRSHHERLDGSGYPDGLVGEQIPFLTQILAIADVFEALTADRPYRAAMSLDEAVAVLEEGVGAHFDADLVNVFIQTMRTKSAVGLLPPHPTIAPPLLTGFVTTGEASTALEPCGPSDTTPTAPQLPARGC